MQEPVEVEDRQDEQAVARVAAVDVAKASGLCAPGCRGLVSRAGSSTKVWPVDATTNAILELADHLTALEIEKVVLSPGPKLVEIIDNRISEMAAKYSATYPSAMKCLTTGAGGLTAYLRFLAEHHNRVRHSNFIERTFGETRRRVKVIGLFPGETSCLTLRDGLHAQANTGVDGATLTPIFVPARRVARVMWS